MKASLLDLAAQVTERPALPFDEGFFRRLFIADRLPGFLAGGLTPTAAEALLADQYRLQCIGYGADYPHADRRVICWRDLPAGRIIDADQGDHLHIVDFLVEPDRRGLGIGTEVLGRVLWKARLTNRPVRLMSIIGSPAQRLYERAGFRTEGVTGDRFNMVCVP